MIESTMQTVINIIAGAVISYIFTLYRAKKKENDALRAGVQALLRDRIIQAYNHYVCEKGWVPIYAKKALTLVTKATKLLATMV